jgi:hypothetical protein
VLLRQSACLELFQLLDFLLSFDQASSVLNDRRDQQIDLRDKLLFRQAIPDILMLNRSQL